MLREVSGFFPYGQLTSPLGSGEQWYRQRLESRSLSDSIVNEDVVLLVAHAEDDKRVYARTGNGTLKLTETDRGVAWRAKLPDDDQAGGLWRAIRRGRFRECSPGFRLIRDDWDASGRLSTIERATLEEISIAERGALPNTNCEVARAFPAFVPKRLERAAWEAEAEMRFSLENNFAHNALEKARSFIERYRRDLLPEELSELAAIFNEMFAPFGLSLGAAMIPAPLVPNRNDYMPGPVPARV